MPQDIRVIHLDEDIGTSTQSDVTLPHSIDPDKSVIVQQSVTPGAAVSPSAGTSSTLPVDDMTGWCEILDADTIRFHANTSTYSLQFLVEIWEYIGDDGGANEFRIAAVDSIDLLTGEAIETKDFPNYAPTVPDFEHVVVFGRGMEVISGFTGQNYEALRHSLHASDNAGDLQIEVQRGVAPTHEGNYYFTAVEFSGSNWQVENVAPITVAAAGTTYTGSLSLDVGDWANAFIVGYRNASSPSLAAQGFNVWPASNTDEFRYRYRAGSTSGAFNALKVYVVANPEIAVYHLDSIDGSPAAHSSGPGALQTANYPLVLSGTPPKSDRLSDYGLLTYSDCSGGGTAHPRTAWNTRLQDDGGGDLEVFWTRARSGQAGDWAQHVIDFRQQPHGQSAAIVEVDTDAALSNDLYVSGLSKGNVSEVNAVASLTDQAKGPDFKSWHGLTVFGASEDSIVVDLTTLPGFTAPRHVTRQMLFPQSFQPTAAAETPDDLNRGHRDVAAHFELTALDELTISRSANAVDEDVEARWTIVQYNGPSGGPNDVRMRSVASQVLADGVAAIGVTLAAGVTTPERFIAVPTGIESESTEVDLEARTVCIDTGAFLGFNVYTIARTGSDGALTVDFQLIEFMGENWIVGQGEQVDYTVSPNPLLDGIGVPVDVISWDQSLIFGMWRTDAVIGTFQDFAILRPPVVESTTTEYRTNSKASFVNWREKAFVLSNPEMQVAREFVSLDLKLGPAGARSEVFAPTFDVEPCASLLMATGYVFVGTGQSPEDIDWPMHAVSWSHKANDEIEVFWKKNWAVAPAGSVLQEFHYTLAWLPRSGLKSEPSVVVDTTAAAVKAAAGRSAITVELNAQALASRLRRAFSAVTVEIDTAAIPHRIRSGASLAGVELFANAVPLRRRFGATAATVEVDTLADALRRRFGATAATVEVDTLADALRRRFGTAAATVEVDAVANAMRFRFGQTSVVVVVDTSAELTELITVVPNFFSGVLSIGADLSAGFSTMADLEAVVRVVEDLIAEASVSSFEAKQSTEATLSGSVTLNRDRQA